MGGSISYVPKEKEKDSQLKAAIALLHGELPLTGKKAMDKARAARFDAAPHAGTSGG